MWSDGVAIVAGVDEAGRGAWAGPVTAAAVVLEPGEYPFVDSKSLARSARERLDRQIREVAVACAVATSDPAEVDEVGVLVATKRAALRAIEDLSVRVTGLVTDYLDLVGPWRCVAPPKADVHSVQVGAASILAKVHRDRYMTDVAAVRWPEYGFDAHSGYGTPAHRSALARLGPCPIHRLSYRPVAEQARLARLEPLGLEDRPSKEVHSPT